MVPQTQSLTLHILPSSRPTITQSSKPLVSLSKPIARNRTDFFCNSIRSNPCRKYLVRTLRCSVSMIEAPTFELPENKTQPSPAEVSRTIMELSSVGTLSTLTQEGWPLGVGVRFAVDPEGAPIVRFDASQKDSSLDKRCSLHVQLEKCGSRTLQCTIQGHLNNPKDRIILKKLNSIWEKRFGEAADESLIHVVSPDRILQLPDQNLLERGEWVNTSDYKRALPDPLRTSASKIVEEINLHHLEDVHRICNIYADLDFKVSNAKIIWVDRLGFDVLLSSRQNELFEVRIPFLREVTDEKGAKSSFNSMSQLAWEVEKNLHVPDFQKVTKLKKI